LFVSLCLGGYSIRFFRVGKTIFVKAPFISLPNSIFKQVIGKEEL